MIPFETTVSLLNDLSTNIVVVCSKASEEELEAAVEAALEAGYRHIDTAAAYANESVIGNVLKRWLGEEKVTRDELFIVTKVWTDV